MSVKYRSSLRQISRRGSKAEALMYQLTLRYYQIILPIITIRKGTLFLTHTIATVGWPANRHAPKVLTQAALTHQSSPSPSIISGVAPIHSCLLAFYCPSAYSTLVLRQSRMAEFDYSRLWNPTGMIETDVTRSRTESITNFLKRGYLHSKHGRDPGRYRRSCRCISTGRFTLFHR